MRVPRFMPTFILALGCAGSALADAKAGEKKAQLCLLCHRPTHPMQGSPLLEGQPARYLFAQMKAYKDKRLADPTMQANVATLSDRDMRDIADYFASRPTLRRAFAVDEARADAGKAALALRDCASCHGSGARGSVDVPWLAGQAPAYTAAQLEAFRNGKRPTTVAQHRLPTDTDVDGVAQHFARLE